jgi:hypothetical protein
LSGPQMQNCSSRVKLVFPCFRSYTRSRRGKEVTFKEEECPMRSIILAVLAPAAIAITASACAAAPAPHGGIIASDPLTVDVAYRAVRRTTVRGPRGGVYHSRTVVAGRRGAYRGGVYASRGVYARGGGYYRRGGVYASRGVYARGGGYYGRGSVYATRGVYARGGRYYGRGGAYATRSVYARGPRGGVYARRGGYARRY